MHHTLIYPSHGKSLSAEFYSPAGHKIRGLIVIGTWQSGLAVYRAGTRATETDNYAIALAQRGFGVLVPDYLAVTGTRPGAEAATLVSRYRDLWEEALSDAIDHGSALSGMNRKPVGLLGFSLGGYLCLRLRRKARALACLSAPVLDGLGLPGTLGQAQIHYTQTEAPSKGAERNVKAIARTLASEGTATELCGYFGTESDLLGSAPESAYLRKIAQARVLGFFDAYLERRPVSTSFRAAPVQAEC